VRRSADTRLPVQRGESREGREDDEGETPFAGDIAAFVTFARSMIRFILSILSKSRMAARQVVAASRQSAAV